MPLHLSLLDGAVQSVAEALDAHDREALRTDAARDPYRVARAVDSAHLGADKLLKHIVAGVDPYLLLKSPRADTIKSIRAGLIHTEASSIFTLKFRVETLDAIPLAGIVKDILQPDLDTADYESFVTALQEIVHLRNHVQHGELYGDGDQILEAVRRLLGGIYLISRELCPEFLTKLRTIHGQAESRLKAYKEEADATWQVLTDFIGDAGKVIVPFSMYIWRRTLGEPLEIGIRPRSLAMENSVRADALIPWDDASGLFHMPLPMGGLGRALRRVSVADLELNEHRHTSSSPPAIEVWAQSSLARHFLPAVTPIRKAILPLNDGTITVRSATATLNLHLTGVARRPFLSADSVLQDWHFSIQAQELTGTVEGKLLSARGRDTLKELPALIVSGDVSLKQEFVLREANDELELPIGTTWWAMEGTLTGVLSSDMNGR